MAIIVLKAWYLDSVLSASQVQQKSPDLRLSRTGLLKTAMRADFLDDVEQVKASLWWQRYLEGELVEFYIEGSGAYSISNLDLISREIYFNKRATLSIIEPLIYFCGQSDYPDSSKTLQLALEALVETINHRYKPILPLQLQGSPLSEGETLLIDAALIRKLKQALLVVADVTPVQVNERGHPLPSPQVCLELGYALRSKRPEQLLLVQMPREGIEGSFPFELEGSSVLKLTDLHRLPEQLGAEIIRQLQRTCVIAP
ncbi:MAG: hypothetical protein Q6K80_07100 [Thermostichus sp. DG_1_6_bins_120]